MKTKNFLFVFLSILFSLPIPVSVYAQHPDGQTKEKKQAEGEPKENEKQAKEGAKLRKQEAEAQAALEKLIPIGKDVQYDRFKDITRVSTKVMNVLSQEEARDWGQFYVAMYADYSVQGNIGTIPNTINLAFVSLGQRGFFSTSADRTLNMIINGNSRSSLGTMEHNQKLVSRSIEAVAWVTLSLKDYQTLVNSKSIEVQIGKVEFALHPRHLEGLRALLGDLPENISSQKSLQTDKSAQISSYSPFVGSWTLQIKMQNNETETWKLSIKKNDNTFTGTINTAKGGEIIIPNIIVADKVFGNTRVKTADGKEGTMFIFGDFKDGNISGKINLMGVGISSSATFEGIRDSEK